MSNDIDPLVNVQAEAVVLGGMLIDNKLILDLSDRLRADDFAEPLHQRIYSAMLRFSAKGARASAISLRPVFAMDRDADGGDYLEALVGSPVAVAGALDLADQIMDLSLRRKTREAMRTGMERLEDLDAAVGDVVGGVEEQVWAAQRGEEDSAVHGLEDLVRIVQQRQERINAGEQTIGATNELIEDLDLAMGQLELSTYVILAGRPGMGKTTLASSAALGYAMRGFPGLKLGTEMTDEQEAMRTVSDLSFALGRGIDHSKIRSGKLDEGDRVWLEKVGEKAAMLPLRYKKIGICNWRRAYSEVAREKARLAALGKKLWFVVIDYIGMLEAEDADGRLIEDPRKAMNAVSKGMLRIRDELGVAVIALAQLSREVDKRTDKRPQMSDLKESGNLEQDADAILFAYREEYYLEMEKPKPGQADPKGRMTIEDWEVEMAQARGKLDIIVGKNRHDQRRTRTARFIGKHYAVRGSSHIGLEDPDQMFTW